MKFNGLFFTVLFITVFVIHIPVYASKPIPAHDPSVIAELEAAAAMENNPFMQKIKPLSHAPESSGSKSSAKAVVYSSDFEGTDGGLTGTLDWEWGTYIWTGS